jgi:hypothetical protein
VKFCKISKNPSEIRILQILDERSTKRRERKERERELQNLSGIRDQFKMSSSFPVWKSSCSDYPSFDSLVESTVDVGVAHSTEKTPFTINKSANATISIAHVETPLSLKVDCLTHPISSSVKGVSASFKHLSNRAGSDLVRELSHKVEQIHIDHGHNRLHTSDVVVTTGGLLNAKFVLHVVGKSSL